ncbi:MAG: hypothetical protein GKR90_26795 [Pseudomonadales bacterium]|nr:hypothetical protein [Pseudomonadales bacterium]
MPHEQLDNLVKVGQLKVQESSDQETEGLIQSGLARLHDSENDSLSIDSRFDLAYNAAHALALAALRKAGYRSESRYLVFQCLKHTLALEDDLWRVLDQAHRKRNIAEYEGGLDIDSAIVEALIRVANTVAERVQVQSGWL